MPLYQPGQRWISDSEAELGLGTILSQEGRVITIVFPATGDTRQYAEHNAPLTRVRFSPGDQITHFEGWQLSVQQVQEVDGLLIYQGIDAHNQSKTLPETQLSNFIQFHLPTDRLFTGQIDPLPWFSLRYATLQQATRLSRSPLWGLSGVRIETIPHQLHIAREVADRHAPRVLLADEVGLGKTIEAGLILYRQLLSGRVQRGLILVPDNLQHQWLVEMLRRFNLQVTLFDQERFDLHEEGNPFEEGQLILAAQKWVCHCGEVQEALLQAQWDILIVDEAHHLEWHPDAPSPQYQVVEHLARQIPAVLLLTATPEQLGQDGHFARLRLLDPDRFHDLQAFREEESHYQEVAEALQPVLDGGKITTKQRKAILRLLKGEADAESLVDAADNGDTGREQLIRALLDRHGTSRLLFRNTRAAISGFPQRQLLACPLPLPEAYASLEGFAQLYPERHGRNGENSQNGDWWKQDPRVDWLIDLLKKKRTHKFLVICSGHETALDLEHALRLRNGIAATVFHEGMTLIERDRAAAYFADGEYGAQVLICSEIGSEGRNFQFAHHMVLFDLPGHPDLLEQRIGRLDRIGQKQTIRIHVPYFQGSVQERLFQWFDIGLNAFIAACPAGGTLQERFGRELEGFLSQGSDTGWEAWLQQVQSARETLEAELAKGRDRLLEIQSSGAGEGERLAREIREQDEASTLPAYMEKLLDIFGVDIEEHSAQTQILRPGEKMLNVGFSLGSDDSVTITYDRALALSREDVQFLTWEHPMVQNGMDLVLSGAMGNTAIALMRNKTLRAGTLLLEALYVSEAVAPRALQLGRFLPPAALRCLLDEQGHDLADKVDSLRLNALLEPVTRHGAIQFVRTRRTQLEQLIENSQNKVANLHQARIAEAHRQFAEHMDQEIDRLSALSRINPNIRGEELEALQKQKQLGEEFLAKASLRLDAVRILVVG